MTGNKPLTGCVVLVENDYFTTDDAAMALRSAGAVILGPRPTVDGAMHVLVEFQPSHAVLDLNLDGQGPRFETACHGASSSLEQIVADLLSLALPASRLIIVGVDAAGDVMRRRTVTYHLA